MIGIKPSHKGKLHKALGVPQGQPIPAGKIAKAKDSSSPALRKEATFAQNAAKWKKPANNSDGNPGYHPSTKSYEHSGSTHSSKMR